MNKTPWRVLLMVGLIACLGAFAAYAAKPGTSAVEGTFMALLPAGDGFDFNTDGGPMTAYVTDSTKYKGFDGLADLVAGDGLIVTGTVNGSSIDASRVELVEATDPPMPVDLYWMTGTIEDSEAYEMVDFWYWWNEEQDEWVIRYIPAAEAKMLKIMTVTQPSAYGEWTVDPGQKYILDFGPDWYAADPCLVDSYICPCRTPDGNLCPVNIGPFPLGTFTCDTRYVDAVMSNDFNMYAGDTLIELMTADQKSGLATDFATTDAYAFGRMGGSEIVWLFECIYGTELGGCDVGEFYLLTDLYPTLMDSNIVWEMRLGSGDNVWWRGEGAPYAKTKDLGCTVIE